MSKITDISNNVIIAISYSILLFFTSIIIAPTFAAEGNSPVGQWKTIDDKTGKEKSIIEITSENDTLTGKIIKLLNPSEPNPVCSKCKGAQKDQPIEGMIIVKGVSKKESSWSGGTILDPKNGKTYKVSLKLIESGQKLKVRGYIGIPALGRTQIWSRVSN
jgi:uncharacterized protein (DUF2147 family)